MSSARRIVLVAVVAVLGIALAAAITWGTSQLVRQRIGLASEPLTAGEHLLPPSLLRAPTPSVGTRPVPTRTVTRILTRTVPVAPPPEPAPAPAPSATPSGTPAESAPRASGRSGSDSRDSAKRDD